MDARRQDRLNERSRSLNDVLMKPVFVIPECEVVRSSIFVGAVHKAREPNER